MCSAETCYAIEIVAKISEGMFQDEMWLVFIKGKLWLYWQGVLRFFPLRKVSIDVLLRANRESKDGRHTAFDWDWLS